MPSTVLATAQQLILTTLLLFICSAPGMAQEGNNNQPPGMKEGWSLPFRGGYVHQFDTDLDEGGSFAVNRFFIQGGPTYSPGPRRSISFAMGYGFDDYNFSGRTLLAAANPWDDIHSLRFSVPVRWGIDNNWTIIGVPTLRFTAENGADWDKALTGGGFAGFSYRVNDRLNLGPGIGIITQLEESATVFPILIIRWKITDRLSLTTGRGLAASMGPGLTLNWKASDLWDFQFGGRYEKLRFRLDMDGSAPGGIGEDSSFPLFLGASYHYNRHVGISLIGGMKLGGELRLENKDGRLINKDNHDPAVFLGFAFRVRL